MYLCDSTITILNDSGSKLVQESIESHFWSDQSLINNCKISKDAIKTIYLEF